MVELDLKKLGPLRLDPPRDHCLMVIDDAAAEHLLGAARPAPQPAGIRGLKQGAEIAGVTLSNPEPVLSVRVK